MSKKTAPTAASAPSTKKQQGSQENDGSLTFTSYPDGSAELEYAPFQVGRCPFDHTEEEKMPFLT